MSALPRLRFAFAAAGLSCLLAGYVVAQQETVRERPGAAIDQPAAQNTAGQTDRTKAQRREFTANFRGDQADVGGQNHDVQRYISGCLLAKNKAEVELAEFAQQQSQSPEVKEFAQMMVQDHGKMIQKLQQMTGTQTGDQPEARPGLETGERTSPSANREATSRDAAEGNTTNRGAGGHSAVDQLLALEKQIVERCTQATKEELQQKQGAEFDKCYIGDQIVGHVKTLAALEVIQQQGPEKLQQIAQEAQPTVQKHLEQAKQIMKQLDSASPAGNRAALQPTQRQR